jgi:hypothetical protein
MEEPCAPRSISSRRSIARRVCRSRSERSCTSRIPAAWSPVSVEKAIREIDSGAINYFVAAGGSVAMLRVVDDSYLRTQADANHGGQPRQPAAVLGRTRQSV